MTYEVTFKVCECVYVEADSEEEALRLARKRYDKHDVDWSEENEVYVEERRD